MTRRHQRAIQGIAAALSVCAFAAPTASAIPAEQFFQDPKDKAASESLPAPDSTPVPVRVVTVPTDSGFDWGDAGIGAGGILALAAIGAGAAVATGHRPGRRQLPQPSR